MGAGAQLGLLRADRCAAEDGDDLDRHVLGVGAQRLGDLDAELAGRGEDERLDLVDLGVEVLQQRQPEGGGLAGPGLGLADHVVAVEQLGDRLLLDRGRLLVAELVERELDLRRQAEVAERGHCCIGRIGRGHCTEGSLPHSMSLTVVGSIAFDSVRTPFGERDRMLGGSAVHFALAASFFTDVGVVGPVGDDFGDERARRAAQARGRDARHRARRGRQDVLLARPLRPRPQHRAHRRHPAERLRRLRAQALGRAPARPRSSSSATSSRTCSAACAASATGASLVALDSMNLWIETTKDALVAAIARGRLPDAQRRRAADADRGAEPRPRRAGRDGAGPPDRRRQARRVRRRPVHGRRLLRDPRACRSRTCATRPAPATASPAASSATSTAPAPTTATSASSAARWPTARCWLRSTSRTSAPSGSARLTRDEIDARLGEFKRLTHFDENA